MGNRALPAAGLEPAHDEGKADDGLGPPARASESENAKNVEENENENENVSEDEEGEEEMQRGRETPIEGGAINMDRVQLMYDQVQTFQLLRHEMRGYVFLERQKREEEDKEFLRRLIREYQADLRATTNAGRIPCRCLARPRQPSPIASATIRCGASPASPTTTMRGRGGGEEADGQQPQP